MKIKGISNDVTILLDSLNHPLRSEIEYLRRIILNTGIGLKENVKWNGPNYSLNNEDRITIKVQPPKNIQIVFHLGAKVKAQPNEKLINDEYNILVWKENNRAIATYNNVAEIEIDELKIAETVRCWVQAATDQESDIVKYNLEQLDEYQPIVNLLNIEIEKVLQNATPKIYHASPVWFIGGNAVVGYTGAKKGVELLFWNGQEFGESELVPVGKFHAAKIVYSSLAEINCNDLDRWLRKSAELIWDLKQIQADADSNDPFISTT
jgi:uncharacterized protein YdhG (YjbR/CyaY superfamily)